MTFLTTRARVLVGATILVAGLAACDEVDPIGPGIGFPESGEFVDSLAAGGARALPVVIANRSGTMFARACGSTGKELDVVVTSTFGGKTDTVGTVTEVDDCDDFTIPVTEARAYRFNLENPGTTETGYIVCWSYVAADCADVAPLPVVDGGGEVGGPPGYYTSANGLTGAALLAALHDIARTGHNGFEYDTARGWLYQDIEDPDDNNLLEDLYAGRVATVDRRFGTATDAGDANFNAEHVWPQSCGARLDRTSATDPARSTGPRGDLHIIYAADASANTSRSNFPYGSIVGTPASSFGPDSAGNFSRRGTANGITVFEPRAEKKGDIARAIFYYYVRYVPEIPASTSLENFNIEEATLRQWHQQDPPDAFERARNDEVYARQGNRNPFVDGPAFLTAIGDFPNTVANTRPTCNF